MCELLLHIFYNYLVLKTDFNKVKNNTNILHKCPHSKGVLNEKITVFTDVLTTIVIKLLSYSC